MNFFCYCNFNVNCWFFFNFFLIIINRTHVHGHLAKFKHVQEVSITILNIYCEYPTWRCNVQTYLIEKINIHNMIIIITIMCAGGI